MGEGDTTVWGNTIDFETDRRIPATQVTKYRPQVPHNCPAHDVTLSAPVIGRHQNLGLDLIMPAFMRNDPITPKSDKTRDFEKSS